MALRKDDLEKKIVELGVPLEEDIKWDNTKLLKKLGDFYIDNHEDEITWGQRYMQSFETVQLCKHMKDELKNFKVSPIESDDYVAEFKCNGMRVIVAYDPEEGFSMLSRRESVKTFLNNDFTPKILFIKNGIVTKPEDYKGMFPVRFILDGEITVENMNKEEGLEFEGSSYENVEDFLQAVLGSLPARAKNFQLNGHALKFNIFDALYYENNPEGDPPLVKFNYYNDKELTKEEITWVETHYAQYLTEAGFTLGKRIPKLLYRYLYDLREAPKYDIRRLPFYKRRKVRKLLVDYLAKAGLPFVEVQGEDKFKTTYLEEVLNNKDEGIILKCLDAPYISALKSSRSHKACMKVKQSISELMDGSNEYKDFDVFITGANPPKSDRIKDMIGSLSCSIYIEDEDGNTEVHEIANVSGIPHEWKRKLAKINEDGSITLNPEYLNKVIAIDGMALSHASLRFQHAVLKEKNGLVFKDKNAWDCTWQREELEKMIIVRGNK